MGLAHLALMGEPPLDIFHTLNIVVCMNAAGYVSVTKGNDYTSWYCASEREML